MHLSAEDREFLERVSASMFANPFSQERRHQDAEMVGIGHSSENRVEIIGTLCATLYNKLESLGPGRVKVSQFSGRDADLVLHGILFWAMHAWWDQFEALIDEQRQAGDHPVQAAFVQEIFEELGGWGVPMELAVRFVGMFHQIHRAYTFIGEELGGEAASVRQLRERLWVNLFTHDLELYFSALWDQLDDFSTFLLGPSGTGKGSAARALGQSGWIPFDTRRGHFKESWSTLLLPINLSQFPDALIESELFGHAKGAFTGAVRKYEGVFSRCKPHGVLFIDEIGEVAEHIQVKLLNVLQERHYSAVGEHERLRFDGRVIAATNRPLGELRGEGGLRDDFYYRLCSDVIEVPSLAKRLAEDEGELLRLVEHVLSKLVHSSRLESTTASVLKVLERSVPAGYSWPGNVRELEQAIRRVVLTGGFTPLEREPEVQDAGVMSRMARGEATLEEVTSWYCAMMYEKFGSYEEVARKLGLDRRTVKKHVDKARA